MAYKQIIIDGVDVQNCCEWYSLPDGKLYCRINNKGDFTCKSNPDCQFKQLARASEEIEKLKVQIENEKQALQIDIDNLNQACLDLNQENDDLLNKLKSKEQEYEELKKNLNEGCLQHLTLMTEQQVLLRTITEIKDIAEVEIECKTYEIENDCFNETRCKALNEHIDFIKQIIQKISECEI